MKKGKIIILVVVVIGLIAAGVGYYYWNQEETKKAKQATEDSLYIKVVNNGVGLNTVEYGTEIDPMNYVADYTGDITVPEVNSNLPGKQTLNYSVKLVDERFGEFNKSASVVVEIKDTQVPVITLNKESITVAYNKGYTLKDNVKSVKDPVDGDLKYIEYNAETEKQLESNTIEQWMEADGFYWIKGTVTKNKAGKYPITVVAYDNHGNKTEIAYTVTVNKKPTTTSSSGSYSGSSGSSSGSGSSSKPSSSKDDGYNHFGWPDGERFFGKLYSNVDACGIAGENEIKKHNNTGRYFCGPIYRSNSYKYIGYGFLWWDR